MACSSAANAVYANPFSSIIPSEASAAPAGILRGRIVSDDGTSLPGSVVTIEQLNLTTTTDVDGFFTISNVPAGEHTVKVSYIGFEPYSAVVKITNKHRPQSTIRPLSTPKPPTCSTSLCATTNALRNTPLKASTMAFALLPV